MNWDAIAQRWSEAEADIVARWPKLTRADVEGMRASKDALVARIEERYGVVQEVALRQVDEWLEQRSTPAEVRPFWEAVLGGVAIVVLFSCLGFAPLPWGPWKYVAFAALMIALMAIVFRRRRRLEL